MNQIKRIQASVLVREKESVNPESGLLEPVSLTPEQIANIEQLVTNAIGIDKEEETSLQLKALLSYPV